MPRLAHNKDKSHLDERLRMDAWLGGYKGASRRGGRRVGGAWGEGRTEGLKGSKQGPSCNECFN